MNYSRKNTISQQKNDGQSYSLGITQSSGLDNHSVIQRIEGKYNQGSCKFAILPTVLSAVSSEKLNAIVSVLRKEEESEEAEEDSAD